MYVAFDREIIEFIKSKLLKVMTNGVIIEKTMPEVLREIFLVGWENYNYELVENDKTKNHK